MERHPEPSLTSKPSSEQIAWAAGLFEGEGFFRRTPVAKRVYLSVGIETRDLDVITAFVTILRAHGVQPEHRTNGPQYQSRILKRERTKKNPNHSDIYRWTTAGHTARHAYELMRPYLGERRRRRADEILAEADATDAAISKPRTCELCGGEFTIVRYGHGRRFCSKTCYHRWKIQQPGQREAARERNRRYKARKKAGPGTQPDRIGDQ